MAGGHTDSQQRPADRWTLVYDGQCGFCRRQIRWIQQRDVAGRFECVPRESPGLTERFPFLLGADFNTGLRLIGPEGRVYVGADGVYQIARQLPRWQRLAWVYQVPGLRAVFRAMYRWVAANRQRLSAGCSAGTCGLPEASGPGSPGAETTHPHR